MKTVQQLAQELGTQLVTQGLQLAAAESCTGGGIAAAVTDIAGSSAWFDRGFVTYSNAAKVAMLAVSPEAINTHGAVSEQVARAMAAGALAHSEANIAVSVTGIAGPAGGSVDKPVGTVWFGLAQDQTCLTQVCCFDGDRAAVRQQAVAFALQWVLAVVST